MPSGTELSPLIQEQNPWWERPEYRSARTIPRRRDVFQNIFNYLGDASTGRAALLLGPRQVGKTTLLLQIADELLDRGWPPGNLTFFDFSDDRLTEPISPRVIVGARSSGYRSDWPHVFLFDEIQEATAWQRWLKAAVDESRREIRSERALFIATGSSAGSLRDGTIESGQGRWDEIPIEGLSYREFVRLNAFAPPGQEPESIETVLGRDPTLFNRYLETGGFPEHALPAAMGGKPLARIRQDVVDRAILRDLRRSGVEIDRVKRLFVYLVRQSGGIWNAQDRAADLEADRKSVEEWLLLLESTRLVHRLESDRGPVKRPKAATQLRPRKKIYAADHGLVSALSSGDPLSDPDIRGRLVEAAVFRHLREASSVVDGRLGYFRRDDDLEIDFVWRSARGAAVAVEVTASRTLKGPKVARLQKAASLLGIARKLLVYDGIVSTTGDLVEAIPLHEFLFEPVRFLEGSR